MNHPNVFIRRTLLGLVFMFSMVATPILHGQVKPSKHPLQLKQSISIDFDQSDFESAVNLIKKKTSLNMHVDWRALESAGVNRKTQVSIQLKDVPLHTALDLILYNVSGDHVMLDHVFRNNVLTISTAHSLQQKTEIRSYDVRALVAKFPYPRPAPRVGVQATLSTLKVREAGNLFAVDTMVDDGIEVLDADVRIENLVTLIQNTVEPSSWDTVGTMNEVGGTLIIRHTPEGHRAVQDLLIQLMQDRTRQYALEARCLVVSTAQLDRLLGDQGLKGLVLDPAETKKFRQILADPNSGIQTVGVSRSININGMPVVIKGLDTKLTTVSQRVTPVHAPVNKEKKQDNPHTQVEIPKVKNKIMAVHAGSALYLKAMVGPQNQYLCMLRFDRANWLGSKESPREAMAHRGIDKVFTIPKSGAVLCSVSLQNGLSGPAGGHHELVLFLSIDSVRGSSKGK